MNVLVLLLVFLVLSVNAVNVMINVVLSDMSIIVTSSTNTSIYISTDNIIVSTCFVPFVPIMNNTSSSSSTGTIQQTSTSSITNPVPHWNQNPTLDALLVYLSLLGDLNTC